MNLETGIHDVDAETYHGDELGDTPRLSRSIAKIIVAESPAHAWAAHPRLNPAWAPIFDEKFDIGTAAHALLLEGDAGVTVVEADAWRSTGAKTQRDLARMAGRIPLLAKHWAAVRNMADAVRAQLERVDVDPPLFDAGASERTLIWDDPRSGVACKARVDWLRHDGRAIDDLKTTGRSANPAEWSRQIFSMGYDVQAAFYLRGLEATLGVRGEFRIVVVETTPPYAVSVLQLGPAAMAIANKKVDYAIALWERALRENRWPGYPTEVCWVELPPWEESRWLEQEQREADRRAPRVLM